MLPDSTHYQGAFIMARIERFTFLIDKDERRLIRELTHHLQRSESDTIRFIVFNAARSLELDNQAQRVEALGDRGRC
jgi:hypothetical protein